MTGFEKRYAEDREEWLTLAGRAEGGVYAMHGFMAFDTSAQPGSPRRLITEQGVVEAAVEGLRGEFGWGALAGVRGPITTCVSVFEVLAIGEPRYVGDESDPVQGGWWLALPVDYHWDLHDRKRCLFRARGRDVALYAREFDERRVGKTSLAEFDYTVEYAVVGNDICVYSDRPDGPEATRDTMEGGEGEPG